MNNKEQLTNTNVNEKFFFIMVKEWSDSEYNFICGRNFAIDIYCFD